jgi:hypothetical protein
MTTPNNPSAAPISDATAKPCPSCGALASGRYCSSCGTALAGAVCSTCSTALTPGARFCHRCGTPAGSTSAPSRGIAGVLPWALVGIALLSLIALVVGQRFGARPNAVSESAASDAPVANAPFAGATGAMPRAPDISQMTPAQQAERLYDRIMREYAAGQIDNVRTFMPMAIAAFERLSPLSLDQRYDLGRIGEVGRDLPLARAQSDTILSTRPTHLLGLILAAKVARLEKNETRARALDARLLAAEPTERAAALPEYQLHQPDIDEAVAAARSTRK